MASPGLGARLGFALLRATPRHALTRALGTAAGWTQPRPLARLAVRAFSRRYALDLAEAAEPLDSYRSVRALFTRALRPGVRPVAAGEEVAVSPADGVVSVQGESKAGQLTQIKGVDYALAALLADSALAEALTGGPYATIYLSPHDYHRVHAPLAGRLRALTYVPGDLWPVNALSVASVNGLFALNERLVFDFDTPIGRCALVMVGATVVGRLRAKVGGAEPFAIRPGRLERQTFAPEVPIAKGQQIGIFDMGSTVVVCWAPGGPTLLPRESGAPIRVGERLSAG